MGYQIRLDKTRSIFLPVCKCPYRNGAFKQIPALVVLIDFLPPCLRQERSNRSIVDGLIWLSCLSVMASRCCSPCSLRTLIISGMKGCNRLEHNRSLASQIACNPFTASRPYSLGRPRGLVALGLFTRLNNLMAAFRCNPVTFTNSSSITPFPSLDA
jgi:hypothetical protein